MAREHEKTTRERMSQAELTLLAPEADRTFVQRCWDWIKFGMVCSVSYGLFYYAWFGINAACDQIAGSKNVIDYVETTEDTGTFEGYINIAKNFYGYVRQAGGATVSKVTSFFDPEPIKAHAAARWNEFGGPMVGRLAFQPVLSNLHGGPLTKKEEFQEAWNKSYAAELTGANSETYIDNFNGQVITGGVSFTAGFLWLKTWYPTFAMKVLATMCSIGMMMAQWEAQRFGIWSYAVGTATIAFSWCGVFGFASPVIGMLGGGAQNIGKWYNPTFGYGAQQACQIATGQRQPIPAGYKVVKRTRRAESSSEMTD